MTQQNPDRLVLLCVGGRKDWVAAEIRRVDQAAPAVGMPTPQTSFFTATDQAQVDVEILRMELDEHQEEPGHARKNRVTPEEV